MNIVDVVILLMVLMYGVIGFKRGFFKETVIVVGTILVIILGFLLKGKLASILMSFCPFFEFGGIFKDFTALNVVLYQVISFLIVISILFAVLNILISVTGVFEKILKYTIILGIPSKILGFFAGIIDGFLIVYIVLFFLMQPAFNISILNDSKLAHGIINNTPILSGVMKNFNNAVTDIYILGKNYQNITDKNVANKDTIDILLKHKIVKVDEIDYLIKIGKLRIVGIDTILDKYR